MKLSFFLALLSVVTIGSNFLFQALLLVVAGPGVQTDAFFAALGVPQLVTALITTAAMQVLMPLLAGASEEVRSRNAWTFVLVTAGGVAILACIGAITARFWAPLLAPGIRGTGRPLLIALTRVQLLAMFLGAVATTLAAVCHARRRFLRAELGLAVATIVSLALLPWVLSRYGVIAAAWLVVLRMAVYTGLLLPVLGAFRVPAWREVGLATAVRRLRPLLLGGALLRADPLVDRLLSSLAPAGGLSLLALGQQVYAAGEQVLQKALVAPVVPLLAEHAAARREVEFDRVLRARLPWCAALALAPYLGVLGIGRWLLGLVAGHGGINAGDVTLLWWILVALGGVLVGGTVGQLTSSAFFARGDTVTPIKLSTLTYSLYLPVKVIAFLRFGLLALPLTTSLYVAVNVTLQLRLLVRRTHGAAG
jgi:putative peptidoglycan lipid II flippase